MMTIDLHAHLEPRMLDLDPMIACLDRAKIDKVALIATLVDPLPETPAVLLAVMRTLMQSPLTGVARRVNDNFFTREGDLRLRGKLYRIYPQPDNEPVARAIAAHPSRFVGWIFLNPRANAASLDELERWRNAPGFVGVKLHPSWHRYRLEEALPIARRCEELGLPMLVHLGFGDGGDWQPLVRACPGLRLVLAHAALPQFQRAWSAIRASARCYIDLSSPFLNERLARAAVAAVGVDKAIYGSDAPYGFHARDGVYDYGHIKHWVERLPLASAEIERILGGNAAEILGIDG